VRPPCLLLDRFWTELTSLLWHLVGKRKTFPPRAKRLLTSSRKAKEPRTCSFSLSLPPPPAIEGSSLTTIALPIPPTTSTSTTNRSPHNQTASVPADPHRPSSLPTHHLRSATTECPRRHARPLLPNPDGSSLDRTCSSSLADGCVLESWVCTAADSGEDAIRPESADERRGRER
jgi:hypothetical protein